MTLFIWYAYGGWHVTHLPPPDDTYPCIAVVLAEGSSAKFMDWNTSTGVQVRVKP